MNSDNPRIILTGFMGVGKTTVAKYLSCLLGMKNQDLDEFIANNEGCSIAEFFEAKGEQAFRKVETNYLTELLNSDVEIIALGGGAWTVDRNRELVRTSNCVSIWLESTFEHCWRNMKSSEDARPLAKNRDQVRKLFVERKKFYCLADWHFVIKPENNSYDVAKQIVGEIFT